MAHIYIVVTCKRYTNYTLISYQEFIAEGLMPYKLLLLHTIFLLICPKLSNKLQHRKNMCLEVAITFISFNAASYTYLNHIELYT